MADHDDTPTDYWTFVDHVAATLPERMPTADVQANQLVLSLNRTSQLITRHLEGLIHRPRGHSWATYRMLFVLWMHEPLNSNQLAELVGITKAGVSNIVGPLAKRGLIAKEPDPDDGRSHMLSLTPAGQAHMTEVFAEQNAAEVEWAEQLTPIERQLLVALLVKLNRSEHAHQARSRRH